MTSAQFNSEMFAMANNSNFTESAFTDMFTEYVDVDATTHTATLYYTPIENSIFIRGLTQDDTVGEGKYTVTTTGGATTLAFNTDVSGDVEVTYERSVANAHVMELDNQESAIGEVIFKWPVYSSSSDCSDSAIKGYYVVHVFRCRVTALPGFDTSYKSAATNQVSWTTLEPKRADGKVYVHAYYPKED